MIIVPKPTSAIDISMSMLTIFSYGLETIHFPFLLFDLPHDIPQIFPLD